MIETAEIKMSSQKMLSVLFMQNGIPWFIASICGIIVFVILGIVLDPRFYILALIWLFMFIPLTLAFLYFFYGMKPLTAFNCIPHKIIFSDVDLKIRLITATDSEESENNNKDFEVNYKDFENLKYGPDYMLLFFREEGWIYLPVSCCSKEDLQTLMNYIGYGDKR